MGKKNDNIELNVKLKRIKNECNGFLENKKKNDTKTYESVAKLKDLDEYYDITEELNDFFLLEKKLNVEDFGFLFNVNGTFTCIIY